MLQCVKFSVLMIMFYVPMSGGWKAIPANQAMYALRSSDFGVRAQKELKGVSDEDLPRDRLSHIYKFGYCTRDAVRLQYFRKSINITFPTWQTTQANYIYLLTKKHTINYKLQCIILKSYVPTKYLFFKSRLPIYYCQGIIYVLMLNTINRYEIHEFFLHSKLNMPINFSFEFYHPTPL